MTGPPRPTVARLFYDVGCGPCTLFAKFHEGASRSRLRAVPYDGAEARSALGDLEETTRYAYAHLVDARGLRSGAAIMTPLVGLIFGPTVERGIARTPALDGGLRWIYQRFWEYRRRHGCAAPAHRVLAGPLPGGR